MKDIKMHLHPQKMVPPHAYSDACVDVDADSVVMFYRGLHSVDADTDADRSILAIIAKCHLLLNKILVVLCKVTFWLKMLDKVWYIIK